jgi:Sulfotransferase family
MLVCHRYQFIFVKTRKTAGTSLEIALSEFCDRNDIITPIFAEDEKIRQNLGYQSPQNYEVPIKNYATKDWLRLALRQKKSFYSNHMAVREIYPRIDSKIWQSYFKFCFDRNPWDKAVSWYYWLTRDLPVRPSFGEFIKNLESYKISNFDVYSLHNKIAVDRVGRFENIEQELEEIAKIIGLPHSLKLPKAKGGYRKDKSSYRDLIETPEKDWIANICSREIKHFGYDF